jgi:hypothetical protein
METSEARQIASPQSLSGAALGGLLFGSGMVLARGAPAACSSCRRPETCVPCSPAWSSRSWRRRACAVSSLPLRESLASPLTTVSLGGNDLLAMTGLDTMKAVTASGIALVLSIIVATRQKVDAWRSTAAFHGRLMVPGRMAVHAHDARYRLRADHDELAHLHRPVRRHVDAVPHPARLDDGFRRRPCTGRLHRRLPRRLADTASWNCRAFMTANRCAAICSARR